MALGDNLSIEFSLESRHLSYKFSPCRKDVVMSIRRKFPVEFKVDTAHLLIDSGCSVAQVARELTIGEVLFGRWVRDEYSGRVLG